MIAVAVSFGERDRKITQQGQMKNSDPILAGFWLANMGRQPGNTVALGVWGLGIKWVKIYLYNLK